MRQIAKTFWNKATPTCVTRFDHDPEGVPLKLQRFPGKTEANWRLLLIGMLLTLVLSLSIHVVMLQVLGIAFPEFAGVSAWASFLNTMLSVLAIIVVCCLAQLRLARLSLTTRYLTVFLLYAMLRESLRGILMNGVVTNGWGFDLVAALPGLASAFVLTSLVMFITPAIRRTWIGGIRLRGFRVPGIWATCLAATAVAALMIFAVRPLLRTAFAPALHAAAPLNHADVYPFPYGWEVLVPAYVTFAEPVIACMLLAGFVWQELSTRPGVRLLQFASLVLLIRGMLLPTFIYSFYSKASLPAAMLSQSQFLFETLALAILTALTWQFSVRSRARRHRTTSTDTSFPAEALSAPESLRPTVS